LKNGGDFRAMSVRSFDPIWEEKYAAGHRQIYPWDAVVSFVFRNWPREKPREQVRILEVGCGTGANLWFAAREGFSVAGIDGSSAAIAFARERFAKEGLTGDLRVSDFTALPFPDTTFDLAFDRGSLTCSGTSDQCKALSEIARCLLPGGRFLYNPYADSHSSMRAGTLGEDGLVRDIKEGTLVGAGQIRFTSRAEITTLLPPNLKPISIKRVEEVEMLEPAGMIHSMWWILTEKSGD
jgi:SAM-dependent methyltransferase